MHLIVHPGVPVDAVDAVKLHAARIHMMRKRIDQPETFVFFAIGSGSWKHQERRPEMAVAHHRHRHAKYGTLPRKDFFFHDNILITKSRAGKIVFNAEAQSKAEV